MMDGTAWMKVMDRQDQSLLMLAVPQPTHETTDVVLVHNAQGQQWEGGAAY